MSDGPERVDTIVDGWYVVTMNPSRDIIHYGSVALRDGVDRRRRADRPRSTRDTSPTVGLGGERFVVTPGLVNTHIHITGEPLTRGYVPDDTPFEENVFVWLCPLYAAHGPADERMSAQLAATEMLRTGTTTFLEAGTIRFLDEVFEGLDATGIRGRLSRWVWDLPPDPDVYRQSTDEAIGHLQHQLESYRSVADGRLGAWSTVVGHTTCSDPLWRAARELADEHGVGLSFHMSPARLDPDGFAAEFGQRPMVHLDELGVLADDVCITHCVHVDDRELAAMARTGSSVAHCPTTALKVSYGVTQIGRMPGDGPARDQRLDRHRRQQRLQLLRPDAGDVPRRRPVQGRPDGPPAVPGRAGARDGHARRRPITGHAGGRSGRWSPASERTSCCTTPTGRSGDRCSTSSTSSCGRPTVEACTPCSSTAVWSSRTARVTGLDEAKLWRDVQQAGEAITIRAGLPDKAKWPMRA